MSVFGWPNRAAQDDRTTAEKPGSTESAAPSGLMQHESDAPKDAILSVRDLRVGFSTRRGYVHAVDGITFSLKRGEIFGLVGESGCGKSTALRSLIGLLPERGVRA